jgi:cob(I)alamin adenosyltransferase
LHLARTITRRAERRIITLSRAEPVSAEAIKYINRLSDYLFVLARYVSAASGGDVLWVPGASR